MTIGIAMSPKFVKNLTVTVDYYHVSQPNTWYTPSISGVIAGLNAQGAGFLTSHPDLAGALRGAPLFTLDGTTPFYPTPASQITAANVSSGTLNVPLLSGGALKTEGIDFGLNYLLDFNDIGAGDFGKIHFFANATVLMTYEQQFGPGTPFYQYAGLYTDGQVVPGANGTLPGFSITTGFTWSIQNFDYTVVGHYIPGVIDPGDHHPAAGQPVNDFTVSGADWQVPDYYKIDMQLAYNFRSESGKKWYDGTRVALGVNNITDNLPPLISSSSEDNTDKSTYDIIGRFVYVQLSKKF
jgi:hypothetical protein